MWAAGEEAPQLGAYQLYNGDIAIGALGNLVQLRERLSEVQLRERLSEEVPAPRLFAAFGKLANNIVLDLSNCDLGLRVGPEVEEPRGRLLIPLNSIPRR